MFKGTEEIPKKDLELPVLSNNATSKLELKVDSRGRMTWQFLNALELFSSSKMKLCNFHFRLIFIFNKKEPQSCQLATY